MGFIHWVKYIHEINLRPANKIFLHTDNILVEKICIKYYSLLKEGCRFLTIILIQKRETNIQVQGIFRQKFFFVLLKLLSNQLI